MDIKQARMCADLNVYTYMDQDDQTKESLLGLGFKDVRFFDEDGAQALVTYTDEEIYIVYRGTELSDVHDMAYNFSLWPRKGEKQGKVHAGFARATDQIWKEISYYVDATVMAHPGMDTNVYFTGHSQGGAMAVISAARSKYVANVYTLGMPRMSNRTYTKNIKSRVSSFVHDNDLVPRLIPGGFYWHFGDRYHLIGTDIVKINGFWHATGLWTKAALMKLVRLEFMHSFFGDHNKRMYANSLRYNNPKNF